MFQKFTPPARQVVVYAQDEARELGHDWIGTEHLLLGLVREERGLAARILASFDVTPDTVRPRVVELLGRGDATPTGQLVFTPRSKRVFERALRESVAMRHTWIGTEHLLIALIRVGDGVANHVLEMLGADDRRVLEALAGVLSDEEDPTDSPSDVV
jgi:ATP-dependent Clp protease ATP-binding subunit ClpC